MTERITLVDKYGQPQSESILRNELSLHKREGLYVEAAIAVVANALAQVIAHRRAEGKSFAGCYDHVCGAIQTRTRRESPEEAAIREIEEERGIKELQSLSYIESGVNQNGIYRHLYLAVATDEPKIVNSDEVASLHILYPGELELMRQNGEPFVDGFFDDLEAAFSFGQGVLLEAP